MMKTALIFFLGLVLVFVFYQVRSPLDSSSASVGLVGVELPNGQLGSSSELGSPLPLGVASESASTRSAVKKLVQNPQHSVDEVGPWLRGRIVGESSLAEPIAGARVRLSLGVDGHIYRERTLSGPDGHFAFFLGEVPSQPVYKEVQLDATLSIVAGEFRPKRVWLDGHTVLREGAYMDVVLRKGPVLTGRVVGPGGQLCPEANVTLVGESLSSSGSLSISASRCDEEGTFVFAVSGMKVMQLVVNAESFLMQTLDLSQVPLAEGGDLGVIQLSRGLAIGGALLCEHGEPVPGVELRAVIVDPAKTEDSNLGLTVSADRRATTNVDGVFRIESLLPGSYLILENRENHGSFQAGDESILLLAKQRYLTVLVVDEQGRPLPGMEILLDSRVWGDDGVYTPEKIWATTEAPGGECVFVLSEGRYDHVVVSVSLDSGQWAQRSLDIWSDTCASEHELVLPSEILTGSVRFNWVDVSTGQATAISTVSAALIGDRYAHFDFDGAGSHKLPVGHYKADLATADPYIIPVTVERFGVLEGRETVIERVSERGGRVALRFSFARPEASILGQPEHVSLSVLTQILGGDWVSSPLVAANGRTSYGSALLGERMVFGRVFPPGPVRLRIEVPGNPPTYKSVRVSLGETTDLDVVLPAQ